MNLTKKQYRVKCWIPIDDAEDNTYDTYDEAFRVRNELEAMQPENMYEVEEVELYEELPKFNPLKDIIHKLVQEKNRGEQEEIVRQLCEFSSFKAFIRDNYYLIHNLGTDKITVVGKRFPKSMLDEDSNKNYFTNPEPSFPKPRVKKPPGYGKRMEEEIQKNRRELGICPVCGCPDYAVHTFKEMGLVHDLWRACRKCKNCGVVRI